MASVNGNKWADEGKMLADLIDRHYDSRKEFAADMGVSDDKVSNWVRGLTRLKAPDRKKAAKLLHVEELALRPSAFVPVVQERRSSYGVGSPVEVKRADIRRIPVYGTVPAGNPATSYSDAIEIIEEADWGNNFDRWGRVVVGSSMLEEFEPGDIVIFENRRAHSGHAVHARKDGEDAFKVFYNERNTCELRPTNPEYEPIDANGWDILGVCIERRRVLPGNVLDIRRYKSGFQWRSDSP